MHVEAITGSEQLHVEGKKSYKQQLYQGLMKRSVWDIWVHVQIKNDKQLKCVFNLDLKYVSKLNHLILLNPPPYQVVQEVSRN